MLVRHQQMLSLYKKEPLDALRSWARWATVFALGFRFHRIQPADCLNTLRRQLIQTAPTSEARWQLRAAEPAQPGVRVFRSG